MTVGGSNVGEEPVGGSGPVRPLGHPRHHREEVGSTNDEARQLGAEGAPHGTTITADRQTAGRGRQGRVWVAPEGQALTVSVVVRDLPHLELLPLAAAVAVAETVGPAAQIKWPNDVVLVGRTRPDDPPAGTELRKLAGILCEARPHEGWGVVGIGLNVALELDAVPEEVAARAATMGRSPNEREAVLGALLEHLAAALTLSPQRLLEQWSTRDVLQGQEIGWTRPGGGPEGAGTAEGVDEQGRLQARDAGGRLHRLDAGEVHLRRG